VGVGVEGGVRVSGGGVFEGGVEGGVGVFGGGGEGVGGAGVGLGGVGAGVCLGGAGLITTPLGPPTVRPPPGVKTT
jgi:hypothetical protein